MVLLDAWLNGARGGMDSLFKKLEDELRRMDREREMAAFDAAPHPVERPEPDEHAGVDVAAKVDAAAREALALNLTEVWGMSRADATASAGTCASLQWIEQAILSSAGLAWDSCEWGPGARSDVGYLEARDPATGHLRKFQWCGATASVFQAAAGLSQRVRTRCMAGTGRLWNCSSPTRALSAKDAAYYMADPRRRILADAGRPGDVLVMGPKNSAAHIGTVVDLIYEGGKLVGYVTVEGNAHGLAADGVTPARGVVMQRRPVPAQTQDDRTYRAHYLVRFLASDYA